MNRLRLTPFLVVLALIAACGETASSPTNESFGSSSAVSSSSPAGVATSSKVAATSSTIVAPASTSGVTTSSERCLHPEVTPFRSWWSESADGFRTEVHREIHGDRAHWVFTNPEDEIEFGVGVRSNVILDGTAWELADGAWVELPFVPIRWPLLVWVNGYVNGPDVVDHLEPSEPAAVAGIPARQYVGGVDEMRRGFRGKMAGREFVAAGTSYSYWVDDCGAILEADVVIELDGEERRIALDADWPVVFRYQYEVYDVGAEFEIVAPEPGYLPQIPPPAD